MTPKKNIFYSILLVVVFTSGCASLMPEAYQQDTSENAAVLIFDSKDLVGHGFTFKLNEGCKHRVKMTGTDGTIRNPSKKHRITPNKQFVFSYFVKQNMFLNCNFVAKFNPRPGETYTLSSKFTGKNYCIHSFVDSDGNPVPIEYSDKSIMGATEKGYWCNHIVSYQAEKSGEFETSKWQDGFEPRRLKRKD